MKEFSFGFRAADNEERINIQAKNLNEALIDLATNHKNIEVLHYGLSLGSVNEREETPEESNTEVFQHVKATEFNG
jgi:hypothetical protein